MLTPEIQNLIERKTKIMLNFNSNKFESKLLLNFKLNIDDL